jgi:hypothetical protein
MDIETDEDKRIYGPRWPKFLANCKAVLGVEAGVSVFDIDNIVRPQYAKIVKGHPDISFPKSPFEKVYEKLLVPYEDNIFYRTISPRHFEAAAFRVCQILFEGKYSEILKPMEHYIPLKKDFSNFDEVIGIFQDKELRSRIIENAYTDLIASKKYSYERFIKHFDDELIEYSSEIDEREALKIKSLLGRRSFYQYMWLMLAIIRQTNFPGRGIIKPLVKPFLKYLGI